jgi:L-fuculose-phosphate aldolase
MSYELWDEWEMRAEMCEVGRRLYDLFFVAANDGNISVRLDENEILITPTGTSKGLVEQHSIAKINPQGEVIACGAGYKPSSELPLHLRIYERRPDIRAVVHAHPTTATGLAVAGVSLDRPFMPEMVVRLGEIPTVPYAIPGGEELPDSIESFVKDYDALLLANHGVLTYADTLTEALFRMETVELNARVYLTAQQLGRVNFLDDDQIKAVHERFR